MTSNRAQVMLQMESMKQRLACAWMYLSWHSKHGRALETLVCSLKRRLFGPTNVYPIIDWEKCVLSCGGIETVTVDFSLRVEEVDALKVDDVDLKMQYLEQNNQTEAIPP